VFIVGAVGLILIATGSLIMLINAQHKIDQEDYDWRQ